MGSEMCIRDRTRISAHNRYTTPKSRNEGMRPSHRAARSGRCSKSYKRVMNNRVSSCDHYDTWYNFMSLSITTDNAQRGPPRALPILRDLNGASLRNEPQQNRLPGKSYRKKATIENLHPETAASEQQQRTPTNCTTENTQSQRSSMTASGTRA